ncbi:MAG: 30S ribosomal protein S27ae [Nanoarchaeota archaeon]
MAGKNKKPKGLYALYDLKSGSVSLKHKSCPKCGSGYILAGHKERRYCGKCHYTEFVKSK